MSASSLPTNPPPLAAAPPPRQPSLPVPDHLARKRARDRKSQRAMRDRAKWTINELQHRAAHLSQALATETANLQALLAAATARNKALEDENEMLKAQLSQSRFIGADIRLEGLNFSTASLSPSADSNGSDPFPVSSVHSPMWEVGDSVSADTAYMTVPWNTEPSCLSDRILQSYVDARRRAVDVASPLDLAEQPDVNALLMPNKNLEVRSVSNLVSDILLAYGEINTLPRKVACLYVMYKLLNWEIFRTKSTYDQLPGWLRPVPLQLQVQHPAWIDRIAWPRARIYLIQHPEITFDDFASAYSSSFEISWPYNPSHVVIPNSSRNAAKFPSFSPEPSIRSPGGFDYHPIHRDESVSINPVYEYHLRQLRNWSAGEKFKRRFPELSAILDVDGDTDFGP